MFRISLQKALIIRNIVPIKPTNTLLKNTLQNRTFLQTPSRTYAVRFPSYDTDIEKVYDGPLTSQIETLKTFSLSFGLSGFILHPLLITQASNISTGYFIAACSLAVITFLTPVVMHLLTKKYVTEILYDPKSGCYKAKTIDFSLARRELNFKPEDITYPSSPTLFTTMKVKDVPLYIEAKFISDPLHCSKLLGYVYNPGVEETKLLNANCSGKEKC